MLSAHIQQSSKQVLAVLYLLSTYSTRFNILLYFIGHCSVIFTAEDVGPAIVRRRLLLLIYLKASCIAIER